MVFTLTQEYIRPHKEEKMGRKSADIQDGYLLQDIVLGVAVVVTTTGLGTLLVGLVVLLVTA